MFSHPYIGAQATKTEFSINIYKLNFQPNPCYMFALTWLQREKKLKENSIRNKIYTLIVENPGIWLREICRTLGKAIGVAKYHLYVLSSLGLIFAIRNRKYKYFFLSTHRSKPVGQLIKIAISKLNNKIINHPTKYSIGSMM